MQRASQINSLKLQQIGKVPTVVAPSGDPLEICQSRTRVVERVEEGGAGWSASVSSSPATLQRFFLRRLHS